MVRTVLAEEVGWVRGWRGSGCSVSNPSPSSEVGRCGGRLQAQLRIVGFRPAQALLCHATPWWCVARHCVCWRGGVCFRCGPRVGGATAVTSWNRGPDEPDGVHERLRPTASPPDGAGHRGASRPRLPPNRHLTMPRSRRHRPLHSPGRRGDVRHRHEPHRQAHHRDASPNGPIFTGRGRSIGTGGMQLASRIVTLWGAGRCGLA
jgi:hypothetical protein